jgi:hypothetical protein
VTLARVLALAGGELVARIGGPTGEAARAALRESATRHDRALQLAAARAPVPEGVRGVHSTWIEAALAELPDHARAALAAGGEDPSAVWLVRWACAELPPLPALRDVTAPRSIEDVVAMARLAEWLEAIGRAQLAYAASLAQPDAPRRDELGPARAVIARCRGGEPRAIAARAIAPYTDAVIARQLAVRLPRPVGLAVEIELLAHARNPVVHAPAWSALVLP